MSQIYGKIFNADNLSRTHLEIIKLVGFDKEVLELGASTGYLTEQMNLRNCKVDIVEIDEEDAKKAKLFARKAFVGSLDDISTLKKIQAKYDVIVVSNILEHLKEPSLVLHYLRNNLKKSGQMIIALPNIACWPIRKDLFFKGKFNYSETGVLDKTHLRFYTYFSAQKLIKKQGFKIKKIIPTEQSYPIRNRILRLGYLGTLIDRALSNSLLRMFPNLIGVHFISVVCLDYE